MKGSKGDFMVAEVQPVAPVQLTVPPGANPAFTVEFDPNAADPAKQFTFRNTSDPSGSPVPNFVWIDDDSVTIVVTLGDGIQFSSPSLSWSFSPPGELPPNPIDPKTISITVPRPLHYLAPWAFWLFVDSGDLTAIQSPSIFLARRPDADFDLKYSGADGSFRFLGDATSGSQAGIELANQLVLINILTPFTFQVNLQATSVPGTPTFSTTSSMVFSTGTRPSWIPLLPAVSEDGSQMTFTVDSSANGQAIGIRFGIVRSSDNGDVTVLSPDPILINATIGDGG
jgi:hypothetical protein